MRAVIIQKIFLKNQRYDILGKAVSFLCTHDGYKTQKYGYWLVAGTQGTCQYLFDRLIVTQSRLMDRQTIYSGRPPTTHLRRACDTFNNSLLLSIQDLNGELRSSFSPESKNIFRSQVDWMGELEWNACRLQYKILRIFYDKNRPVLCFLLQSSEDL